MKEAPDRSWQRPDWRNRADYEYVRQLKPERQRWEVLRRLPEYQAAWRNGANSAFNLSPLVDPATRGDELAEPFRFNDDQLRGRVLPIEEALRGVEELYESGFVMVAIDLLRPLRTQLETAEKQLEPLRQMIRQARPDVFVERDGTARSSVVQYIRTMDAIADEANWREAVALIWDGSVSESDARKRLDNFLSSYGKLFVKDS
jgi:hypothetical protein